MMYATVRWEMGDTSKIVSYALYRTSKMGKDTVSEKLRGNCIGTVLDGGGAPIPGVRVLLVPELYAYLFYYF